MNTNIDCFICLSPVCVPVRIIAFQCPVQIGKPGCHDIQRACLNCARNFLQLNMNFKKRKDEIRCPFCPTKCNPRFLNAIKSYKKDYLMMSLMTNKISCPNTTDGCVFESTQSEMDKHLNSHCLFRYQKCSCGEYIKIINVHEHSASCSECEKCSVCERHMQKNNMLDHLERVHRVRPCVYCHEKVTLASWDVHQNVCPERPVQCQYCNLHFYNKDLKIHLREEYEKQQRIIREGMDKLRSDQMRLDRIANDLMST